MNVDGYALAASYVGVLGLLVVFGAAGPVAVALGIIAHLRLYQSPGKRGRWRASIGIVLGLLQTAVLVLILVAVFGLRN